MKNTLTDLRNHLFDVIERLKDPQKETPIDYETAIAICLAAKRLIETADVEIKFRNIIGKDLAPSDFLRLPLAPVVAGLAEANGRERATEESNGKMAA